MKGQLQSAEIVAVGSELLTPHRVDTNSLFLSGAMAEVGIRVRAKHVVGDDREELGAVLSGALARADVVITTGGLGPTDDDLTRDVVARVLGRQLVESPDILAGIEERFTRRAMSMPAVNRRQAQVIEDAQWLNNPHGTAPGQLIVTGDRVLVLLPGPPRELQPMFIEHVAPVLAARAGTRRLHRRVIKTTGRSESMVEELTQPIYSRLVDRSPSIETTILAGPGLVELHLSAIGDDEAVVEAALGAAVDELVAAVGDAAFSCDGRTLEQVVGSMLSARNWRVAAAESCTGGLLMQRLTDVPGSSAWFDGGTVAYANRIKVNALGVSEDDLRTHGAVSEVVARAMAEGVRNRTGADLGVAITGIAGPDGGSDDKPVGTVYIAVAGEHTVVGRSLFPGDRGMVRMFAASAALDLLRRFMTA